MTVDALRQPETSAAALRRTARLQWERGDMAATLDAAWRSYQAGPDDQESKVLLAGVLAWVPGLAEPRHEGAIHALMQDAAIDPLSVSNAGWTVVLQRSASPSCAALEADALALTLLAEAPVADRAAEALLTGIRRTLLLTRAWKSCPRLAAALCAQAVLNSGAWVEDAEERAALATTGAEAMRAAYGLPNRIGGATDDGDVTRAVARQYEQWPYPRWRRVTRVAAAPPPGAPPVADILIAGCGTGREAAMVAVRHPDARVVAIDISSASLSYAAERCAEAGIDNIRFVQHDLNRAAELDQSFDLIHCTGVLHHLAGPEAGLAALTRVLRPAAAMRIAVYSSLARLGVQSARRVIADLAHAPLSDDLLRSARARIMAQPAESPAHWVSRSPDFATLEGTLDLLLHRHEDCFDVSRIGRALGANGLTIERFLFPTPDARGRYDAQFPDDAAHRDLAHIAAFERREPRIFAGMYNFWCRRAP